MSVLKIKDKDGKTLWKVEDSEDAQPIQVTKEEEEEEENIDEKT